VLDGGGQGIVAAGGDPMATAIEHANADR